MATTKKPSKLDANQTLQGAFNDNTSLLSVDGFVTAKINHRIVRSLSTTTLTNDTEIFTYFDGATQLLQLSLVYTDDTLETFISVERTA